MTAILHYVFDGMLPDPPPHLICSILPTDLWRVWYVFDV
jgi:hypothetical protein